MTSRRRRRTGSRLFAMYVVASLVPVGVLGAVHEHQLASTAQYEPGLYGIIVAKDQPRLRDAVQGALEELMRSGVYTDVLARWNVSDGALRQVTVNSER